MRIYVASSWRNVLQPAVVRHLRDLGHSVYDFRNPAPGNNGFRWTDIDPNWQSWTPQQFRAALDHPIAVDGFGLDKRGMEGADGFCLVLPCGRSAHLELGWATGRGLRTAVLLDHGSEPELMYRLVDHLCASTAELAAAFA